ncbi:cytochrome P450 [Streptomyces sp. HNM0574]|uniref:cytochrome P450 n=1 Tax=Streptomyces sp. HNM0574 TaxID=2714954 RepID=UPI00146D7AE4|nr:cytochrome P450 [Streptomyces sp. HNM0574]NLU68339.1 cytochrome P450 [Streptomyces sp. HNM0574]
MPQSAPPDILSEAFAADPYPAYRVLREEYPLLWHEATGSYLVSRYEDVQRAFREPVFTTENYVWQLEPVHGRTIVQLSGREHAVRRALLAPAFRGRTLEEKFLPVIERNAGELIEGILRTGSGTADLVDAFATRFPINVIVDMLGLDKADHPRFHAWYTAIVGFFSNLSQDPEVAAAGLRTRDELAAYMIPVIRERRAAPGDDLLSVLCEAEIDGTRMSDEEIKAFVSLLFAAGGETTDKAVSGVLRHLLEHPAQLAAVREDRTLIGPALAETLRRTPPVQMIMREAAADVTLSGGTVPAGSTVNCLIGAANRDPERFTDPDVFDLHRPDLTASSAFSAAADHLAFALGRHFCVGALLAKAEVETAVSMLLDALPGLALQDGRTPREEGVFVRGLNTLPVRFTP